MSTSNEEMVTDSLVRYIQAIQRGRRTGVLIVKRGSGNTQEEGRIRFRQGHVSETTLGLRSGTLAFNELSTWGSCLISFISADGQEMKASLSPLPSSPPSAPSPPAAPSPPSSSPQASSFPPGSSPLRRRSTPPPDSSQNEREKRDQQEPARFQGMSLQARPSQTRQFSASLKIIENLQLSRAHRQLFLLINGQRSIEELISLSTRSQDEVLQLLRDLERAAVIRILH